MGITPILKTKTKLKSPIFTYKKRVTLAMENNKEYIIDKLFTKNDIPNLWTTKLEKQKAART